MHPVPLKRIKNLILVRVLFISLLLGTFFLFEVGSYRFPYPSAISFLIASFYLLSVIYGLLLNRTERLVTLAYVQLCVDAAGSVLLVLLTGGIQSWFSSIMLLTVMASAIVLNKRAGYVAATICGILYGLMIDLQFYGIIPVAFDPLLKERDFLYNIFTHLSALYLTAFLTGHLSSRLEKTTESLAEKDSDLRDLTLFNRELIENLPSGLLTTDEAERIVILNKAAEQVTGLSLAEAMELRITDIFPFLKSPVEPGRAEGTLQNGDRTKTVGLTISAMTDSTGSRTGYVCVFQDITQIKNLEAEVKHKATLAAIGELSANMAHEIRNPLASLKGSIEMLKERTLTKEHSENLMNIAISEMDRLNKIISDFLTYSRPRPPDLSWVDLHVVLNETVELLRSAVSSTLITIHKDFSGLNELFIDPSKLRQVFLNLGMNSIESMPSGGELTITTMRKKDRVTVYFKDTGVGILPEHIREVFYPFFTTKDRGTGLGLSIAYRIVEEHHGAINLSSTPGHGTTFEVVIPVVHMSASEEDGARKTDREMIGHGKT
jgi:two-component system sensor histidine kinase PilS (NtrC family)